MVVVAVRRPSAWELVQSSVESSYDSQKSRKSVVNMSTGAEDMENTEQTERRAPTSQKLPNIRRVRNSGQYHKS
jgi:hypothetical protein